jgi:two-component system chemotaxis response regulator CheY
MNKNIKILTIDDHKTTRNIISGFLKELGFKKVYKASDGKTGLDTLKKHLKTEPFDLVISDINMPRMNGLEFLSEARKDKLLGNLKIIMCTTLGDYDTILEAADTGATNYIVKPITIEKIREKLVSIFEERI